jgi:hypothetical protein
MHQPTTLWEDTVAPASNPQLDRLGRLAQQRNWGLSLVLVGWLHLVAFSLCHYLTVVASYNDAPGYLVIWGAEFCGLGLIFRLCGGPRTPEGCVPPVAKFIVRVWISYFLLAFNLCSMNALRGHRLFELFPAMASLASFAFLVLTFAVSRRFFLAVLVMFAAGLLMAANLLHSYLVFALAWWLVLNGIGLSLLSQRRSGHFSSFPAPGASPVALPLCPRPSPLSPVSHLPADTPVLLLEP